MWTSWVPRIHWKFENKRTTDDNQSNQPGKVSTSNNLEKSGNLQNTSEEVPPSQFQSQSQLNTEYQPSTPPSSSESSTSPVSSENKSNTILRSDEFKENNEKSKPIFIPDSVNKLVRNY